jgi:hypothetical protein
MQLESSRRWQRARPPFPSRSITVRPSWSPIGCVRCWSGRPDSNPFIRPGDIISIPETDQIFVTGAVVKPGATPLRSRLTLIQALGIAGGFAPDAARSRIRDRAAGSGLENPPGTCLQCR